jgi:CxxC motif-containing protein
MGAGSSIAETNETLGAVVMVAGALEPLSVKTAEPIPKNRIFDVMEEIRALRLQAPIQAGQVLIEDAAETGISIIATKTI